MISSFFDGAVECTGSGWRAEVPFSAHILTADLFCVHSNAPFDDIEMVFWVNVKGAHMCRSGAATK